MEVRAGYKKTEVGVIPEDWEIVPLGRLIFAVEYGSAAKSNATGRIPVLRMGNMQGGKIDWNDLVFTDDESEIKRYSLIPGDVLFNRTNTIDLVGKTAIYKGEQPAVFAGYLIRINTNKALLESRFLNYILNAEFSRKHSAKVLSVAVGQANINGKKLKTYPIPLPPTKAEQEAIAEALSDADALIESLEQLIAKKRQIKQGAMQELLTGKKRLPGFSGEWEVKRLGAIATIRDGTHQTPKYVDSGIPFYSVEHVTRGDFTNTKFISEEEHRFLTRSFRIEKGDILMTRIGSIGDCKFIDWDVDASFYVSLALLKIHSGYSAAYITHYSKTDSFKKEVELHSLQSAIPKKINLGPISNVKTKMPPLPEQIAISTVLSDMDAEIAGLEEKLAKARQVKQGMMQELLTGRIRLI